MAGGEQAPQECAVGTPPRCAALMAGYQVTVSGLGLKPMLSCQEMVDDGWESTGCLLAMCRGDVGTAPRGTPPFPRTASWAWVMAGSAPPPTASPVMSHRSPARLGCEFGDSRS